eukprot:s2367_g10.t1
MVDDGNWNWNWERPGYNNREDTGDRGAKLHNLEKQSRNNRDLLRFMYQTTAKGKGKGFPDWLASWKQCRLASVNCDANYLEGHEGQSGGGENWHGWGSQVFADAPDGHHSFPSAGDDGVSGHQIFPAAGAHDGGVAGHQSFPAAGAHVGGVADHQSFPAAGAPIETVASEQEPVRGMEIPAKATQAGVDIRVPPVPPMPPLTRRAEEMAAESRAAQKAKASPPEMPTQANEKMAK